MTVRDFEQLGRETRRGLLVIVLVLVLVLVLELINAAGALNHRATPRFG